MRTASRFLWQTPKGDDMLGQSRVWPRLRPTRSREMIKADFPSRAVGILGMHRSGTSTVAGAISLLGVPLGESDHMMPPGPDNSAGYWEQMEIYDFQRRLMARLERTWDAAEPLPKGWPDSDIVRPFQSELAAIIEKRFGRDRLWAWKEPKQLPFASAMAKSPGAIGRRTLLSVRCPKSPGRG